MSPRWVKGAQGSLESEESVGHVKHTVSVILNQRMEDEKQGWQRGCWDDHRRGGCGPEKMEGTAGDKSAKVTSGAELPRWSHIQARKLSASVFFLFSSSAPVLTELSFSKETPHKLQTGHDCDTYVITCWAVSLPAWFAHPRAPSLPPGKETAEIRQSEGGKCLVVECFNIMAWLCSSRSDRFICMREKRQAASCWLWSAGQNSQTEKILPLKTTSELWLSQLVSRPNALVIILLTAVMDRKRRKKTW